ncbi:Tubulin-tyrosine ligase family protein [Tritrichomonas foetus]|uniref:Tubulin--tyrosine ligase-like protein 5 n=1 Tax=Tritrichomonas foetus TaxID=1144522 RepID=A0A1J4K186_9EUKA|nr:Tubulin-tyrosine ligase family protein [Tritrichomonas foetus]|eukprot:OHT03253.1 Tubulin-tyrosine ligase family protein [Tritrichomonas foetus]
MLEELVYLFKTVPLPFIVIDFPDIGTPQIERNFEAFAYKNCTLSDIHSNVLFQSGFKFQENPMLCHLLIGGRFNDDFLNKLNDFQKVCHFSSTNLIGSKDELHFRMLELKERLGHSIDFYPEAYYPPDDYEKLLEIWTTKPVWIIKAPALSRARNIRLAIPSLEPAPKLPYVIEEYITPPYLITGRKFDIRIYAVVTSIEPLIFYYHKQGLVLFATHDYAKNFPNDASQICEDDKEYLEIVNDLQMHLTNYEINKDSKSFVQCYELDEKIENSKWSLPFLWKYFKSIGVDYKKIKRDIKDVATAAIIAGMCSLRNSHRKKIKLHRKSSFELLGIDILLDSNLKPYLLEINISPGMVGSSQLDIMIKEKVTLDTFHIVRVLQISPTNRNEYSRYIEYERQYKISKHFSEINKNKKSYKANIDKSENNEIRNRIKNTLETIIEPWENPAFAEYTIIREFIDELSRKRDFHLAYPKKTNISKFEKHFDHYTYEDIVLNKWLMMDQHKRFDVLLTNFDLYHATMEKCYQAPDRVPNKTKHIESKDTITENNCLIE